jgi:hypothetical protein
MSLKFGKNRSVSEGYFRCPMYYTNIIHPKNKHKELVLMDRMGDQYTACWRNDKLSKVGIYFTVKATDKPIGFIFKDKQYLLKDCNKVW